ncbi:MAG: hypothetical protein JSR67_02045 [Proteobacteria bacterium]|nr:hypothetical protein [Pseudomonadota bacterium]
MPRLSVTTVFAVLCLSTCGAILASPPAKPGAAHTSSFAPRSHGTRRIYGAPIQPPIMRKRSARRWAAGPVQQPQLRSSPLPDSPSISPPASAR